LPQKPLPNTATYTNVTELYNTYFDKIKLETLRINYLDNTPENYDDLFDVVLKQNSKIYQGLWNNYIQTPSLYTNLHLILVKTMMYYVKSSKSNNYNSLRYPINVQFIKSIYEKVLLPNVSPYLFNERSYGSKNKLLKTQMDIISHIVRTNIMTNLANLIYAILINYQRNMNGNIDHSSALIKKLYDILVNKDLALKITKHVLKVYNEEHDDKKSETKELDMNFVFADLDNYLRSIEFSNNLSTRAEADKMMQLINDTVKVYYDDLLVSTIESMKLTLDNYCIYIMNDYKYLEILNIFANV